MTRKDLKKRLPNLPDEHLNDVLKVIRSEKSKWTNDGITQVKSLIYDVLDIPHDALENYCVARSKDLDGG